MTKHDQSLLPVPGVFPDQKTVYKVASFCQNCRFHLDLVVDFSDYEIRNSPCPSKDYPLHHFIYQAEDVSEGNMLGNSNVPKTYRFQCSSTKCPAELRIRMRPPRLKDEHIRLMTDRILLRKRLESAKILDPGRTDHRMARPVDGYDFLSTYLKDSLNPTRGKSRVPLLNRKFLVTFGRDCDEMLRGLGFSREIENPGNGDEICWHLPKPPAPSDPLSSSDDSLRTVIQDVIEELSVLILSMPDSEKQGVRNMTYQPKPSQTEIERALGCLDYSKRSMTRAEVKSAKEEEDHPYYAGLGALGDFSDELLLFAYSRQVGTDVANSPYYFECLQDLAIGRKSSMLEEKVQMLASQGQTNRKEVAKAYSSLGMDHKHAELLSDEIIIGQFKSRLQDISPALEEDTRNMLRIIGQARQSQRILQEASNAIETYEQALSWLDLDPGQPDEFVQTMFTVKAADSPANRDIAVKAVEIIAESRNSARLRDFLRTGAMGAPEMDIEEAYRLLGIKNRSETIDFAVLESFLVVQKDAPYNDADQLQQAYDLLYKERGKESYDANVEKPRAPSHPLEIWPVGCENIGNTCYLNSVLQFLFTIRPLREMILNFDDFRQEPTPEALESKRVGRSTVSVEKVKTAQEFVFELRKLFQMMITAPSDKVRPDINLAFLALFNAANATTKGNAPGQPAPETNTIKGLGDINGMPLLGPMPNPFVDNKSVNEIGIDSTAKEQVDSVLSDAGSLGAAKLGEEGLGDWKEQQLLQEDSKTQKFEQDKPDPPSRPPPGPPPVPPRPKTTQQSNNNMHALEAVARQQDAAEVLQNIFDLLRCAMRPSATMDDGEQFDLINELFYSQITTARTIDGVTNLNTAVQDFILTSPGDRNRHLYTVLDDEFDLVEEDITTAQCKRHSTKYEFIDHLPPILMINVRRLIYDANAKGTRKIECHIAMPETLYLDRYLHHTNSLSAVELLERRMAQWDIKKRLRQLQRRKTELEDVELDKTELKISLADVVDGAADYVDELQKTEAEDSDLVNLDPLPIEPGLSEQMRLRAHHLRKDAELLSEPIRELEEESMSIFADLKDHPYLLQAVFIHRGTATGGHYWIYIHDFKNNIWRKYNDDVVTEVTDLADIFTQEEVYPATSTGMVYVRKDDVMKLTEAVKRNPAKPPPDDVEMKDAGSDVDVEEYANIEILNGVDLKMDAP